MEEQSRPTPERPTLRTRATDAAPPQSVSTPEPSKEPQPAYPASVPTPTNPQWEYKIDLLRVSEQRSSFIDHPGPSSQKAEQVQTALNRRGQHGWELVGMLPVLDARGAVSHAYYHFRRLQPGHEQA